MRDPDTGLLDAAYFEVAIEQRTAAARRGLRPLSLVLLHVDGPPATTAPRAGEVLRATLRASDTACRLTDGRFALLLEETPENGAVWTVERIRRSLAPDGTPTMWAGVACYPAHALDATSLRERADAALALARDWRQGRIEVALPAE